MDNPQKVRPPIRDWLLWSLALSPTLILALAVVWDAISLKWESGIGLEDPAFFARLFLLVPLCVPLLLGIGAAVAALRLHAPRWATILLAIGVVSAPYVFLIVIGQMGIARCQQSTPELMCGEGSIYVYCVVCAMNLANAASVVLLIVGTRSKAPAARQRAFVSFGLKGWQIAVLVGLVTASLGLLATVYYLVVAAFR